MDTDIIQGAQFSQDAAAGQPAWGSEEYMFHMLRHNGASLPWEGLAALRLCPLRCWHAHGAYAALESGADRQVLPWAQTLHEVHEEARAAAETMLPEDTPDVDELWPHYEGILRKYLPTTDLRW